MIATENPSGSAGTQLLPESQLDRFMVCVKMGYPTIREEMEILRKNENGRTSDAVQQVMTKEELEEAQRETAQHRILLNTRARISKVKQKEVLQEILSAVESPSLKKR